MVQSTVLVFGDHCKSIHAKHFLLKSFLFRSPVFGMDFGRFLNNFNNNPTQSH